ncbi:16S rRNA (cytosine1402-N4)-methyltransferase [Nitrosomonas eutropha]|uniref:16S rRNA (cytosine(1402)-N(4))-methyltransferase RsmH n=1 Tax=Nitrosomonas TaxID=914 RepID=UPI000884F460|nr:16S rRNA (cytosine(1402)-N(4))-methyltransferase RsmH [Nitrosomonas eutropha]MXS80969.1 16S rRNA (cytosine(1402)-N(4))-methyltransferase RsmH [Nitrosomonas sp. GH22]SCX13459.1 16S rRNA (cytosine1402-N4)-methyltransferase [Nitrosomonas eutropha]SDW14625.1 16S rRNA (cytosine1402-N4)-methyltransferase [Nitrosomonas eutropha]
MHISVLLEEVVDALNIQKGGIYVDGTYGRGGHSRLILSRLDKSGQLIAFDKDPAAISEARSILDERFQAVHSSYAGMYTALQSLGINRVDGILLDLGVSSIQLDEASRGFSFRHDGPLDMRMDSSRGKTAAEWLTMASETELKEIIRTYGEERYAGQIASAIVMEQARQPISTTLRLAEIVAAVVRKRGHRDDRQHPATRTFQAIRIHLNQELEELSMTLPQCVELLNTGGRLVVISFHSLEDRIVKRFMRMQTGTDTLPRRLPIREEESRLHNQQKLRIIGKKIRPGSDEVSANPRARSAVMRVAEKLETRNAISR